LLDAKPSYRELDEFVSNIKIEPMPTAEGIDSKLKLFYGSLGTK
jgi:hypothetical protein